MGKLIYRGGRFVSWFIRTQTIRQFVLHGDRANRTGGYVLALTHVGHVEPFIVGAILRRQIYFMSRIEFFKYRPFAALLRAGGAFPVNRQGRSISAIRRSVALVEQGDIVGIFPEGGRVSGPRCAVRGAAIKQGAATVALRAGVPIVPVVVLGTDALTKVGPWLPARRGRAWVAFAEAIDPPALPPRSERRAARIALARRLERAFVATYAELLAAANITDAMTR